MERTAPAGEGGRAAGWDPREPGSQTQSRMHREEDGVSWQPPGAAVKSDHRISVFFLFF